MKAKFNERYPQAFFYLFPASAATYLPWHQITIDHQALAVAAKSLIQDRTGHPSKIHENPKS
jgi:hypothetical protein